MIIFLFGFNPVGLNITHSRILSSIPLSQTFEIVQIHDNHNNIWGSSSILDAEVGEILEINAQWNQNAFNASITLEGRMGSIGPWTNLNSINASIGSNGTFVSNFLISVEKTGGYDFYKMTITAKNITSSSLTTTEQIYKYYDGADPGAPSSVKYTRLSESSLKITWTAATDNVGVKYYKIYRVPAQTGVVITVSNAESVFTSNITEYIDSSVNQTIPYFYAVQAIDYANRGSTLVQLSGNASVDRSAPRFLVTPLFYYNDAQISENQTKPQIGLLKIEVQTEPDCVNVTGFLVKTKSTVNIQYEIVFIYQNGKWVGQIDLANPKNTGPIMLGTYDLILINKDLSGNQEPLSIKNFITIENPIEETGLPTYVYIIIAVGAVGAIVGIVLFKKKAVKEAAAKKSDLEISEGPAKRKRGKVYSGASSIGRASGRDAEMLQERRGAKSTSASAPSSSSASKKSVSRTTTSTSYKTKTDSSSGNIDDLLQFDTSAGTGKTGSMSAGNQAMAMKQAEASIETTRRMDFTIAKLASIDQNVMLMNLLLNQTAESEQIPKSFCPTCGQPISSSWAGCPYCFIDENKDFLKQKMQEIPSSGIEKPCAVCRKMLHPSWKQCPFCLIRQNPR
jgi:hypothetical protein